MDACNSYLHARKTPMITRTYAVVRKNTREINIPFVREPHQNDDRSTFKSGVGWSLSPVSTVCCAHAWPVQMRELDSYDDRNFLLRMNNTKYLVKVHNVVDSVDYIKAARNGTSRIDLANPIYHHLREYGVSMNSFLPVNVVPP